MKLGRQLPAIGKNLKAKSRSEAVLPWTEARRPPAHVLLGRWRRRRARAAPLGRTSPRARRGGAALSLPVVALAPSRRAVSAGGGEDHERRLLRAHGSLA